MTEAETELLNVYDAEAVVVGHRPRGEARKSGLAVGAVNALVRNSEGRVLLQLRPEDKENGGLWDKTVGGHVSAGEDFDDTMIREAGEELFDDPRSSLVRLAPDEPGFDRELEAGLASTRVLLRRAGLQKNLRDVRRAPGGGSRRVVYHVACYLGHTDLPLDSFRPQASEIQRLELFWPHEVDALLIEGHLAPNMSFLWLTQARALLLSP